MRISDGNCGEGENMEDFVIFTLLENDESSPNYLNYHWRVDGNIIGRAVGEYCKLVTAYDVLN